MVFSGAGLQDAEPA